MASQFRFTLADHSDDNSLRRRMADDHMEGSIVLSFRREPDYFFGCAVQGEDSQIIKCTDTESDRIVGLGARHTTRLHVNGDELRVGYLSDLRADPSVRRRTLLVRGYSYLRELHESDPLPFYFSVILEGNQEAISALTTARAGLPVYKDFGRILTPAIHLDRKRPELTCEGVVVRRGSPQFMPGLFEFLEREAKKKQFAPCYRHGDLATRRLQGLKAEDFYIASQGDRIIGCVAAWDQSGFRQTHVKRYSRPLRVIRSFYNLAARLSPLHPLPNAGEMIPYLYLAFIAVENSRRDIFATLLRSVYRDRRNSECRFMVAGLHERDPLCPVLDDYRSIDAAGRLFIIYYPEQAKAVAAIDNRTPHIEMAAV